MPDETHSPYEEAVPAASGTAGPRIGQDEWVARSAERRGGRGGRLGVLEARLRTVPWWAWLILFVAVVAPCRWASRAATSAASPSTP